MGTTAPLSESGLRERVPTARSTQRDSFAVSAAVIEAKEIKDALRFLPPRYEPLKLLGVGGMGTVYQCRDQALERLVAIKIVNEFYRNNPHGEKRFMREARAQAIVNHPNVATVLNYGVSPEGRPFLIMEHIEGETFRDILAREGPLEPLRACELIRQVCEGLAAAHAAGLIHRDLKPSNVMVARDHRGQPRVKILDLGLVKIIGGNTDLKAITRDGNSMVVGTPAYMSPEQVTGGKLDGRSDLYSLGIVFYELLTGRLPFESETLPGWLYQHLHAQPLPPSRLNPALAKHPQLEAVLLWMLAKRREDRPDGARELAAVLQGIGAGNPAVALPRRRRSTRPPIALDPGATQPPPDNLPGPVLAPKSAPVKLLPATQTANDSADFLEQYERSVSAALAAESAERWQDALDAWEDALALAARTHATNAENLEPNLARCRREVLFENELAAARKLLGAGDWEHADAHLARLAQNAPFDVRLEKVRAKLLEDLSAAWLKTALAKVLALPDEKVRLDLLERLSIAFAQSGDLDAAQALLQTHGGTLERLARTLAQAVAAAARLGCGEGLRPCLDKLATALEGLSAPADRGRAQLEAGRALAAYGDQAAARQAFQTALQCFAQSASSLPALHTALHRPSTAALRTRASDDSKHGSGTQVKITANVLPAAIAAVAEAQAECGLGDDSLETVKQIDDAWTLAQTLSKVSQSLSRNGRDADAERIANQIAFALPKAHALRALGLARVGRGEIAGAEKLLASLPPPERVSLLGHLAAGYLRRSAASASSITLSRAAAHLAAAQTVLKEVQGPCAQFQAALSVTKALLDEGLAEHAHAFLAEAARLSERIEDSGERVRALLQLAALCNPARVAGTPITRTAALNPARAGESLTFLRDALVVARRLRAGAGRGECLELLATAIGAAGIPLLANELLASFKDPADHAVVCIGLSVGVA